MNKNPAEIGERIKAARKAAGLSQTELANRLSKTLRTVQKYESGEIEPSIAIINAMAKELTDLADIARCHAVGQACSVVHTAGHALGYPMYDLTAIVLELGLDDCRDAVEHRVRYYEQRLHYWAEHEKSCSQNWASFLRK